MLEELKEHRKYYLQGLIIAARLNPVVMTQPFRKLIIDNNWRIYRG